MLGGSDVVIASRYRVCRLDGRDRLRRQLLATSHFTVSNARADASACACARARADASTRASARARADARASARADARASARARADADTRPGARPGTDAGTRAGTDADTRAAAGPGDRVRHDSSWRPVTGEQSLHTARTGRRRGHDGDVDEY